MTGSFQTMVTHGASGQLDGVARRAARARPGRRTRRPCAATEPVHRAYPGARRASDPARTPDLPEPALLARIREARHRRRPGDAPAPTARAGSPTPTTPPPGGPSTFIEDFIRDEVLPRYANTHTESQRHRAADHPAARGRARGSSTTRVGGDDDTVRHLLRLRVAPGRSTSSIGILNLRIPADLDDRYDLAAQIPRDRAPGGLHRPVRAPLATSCRGASRSPTSSPSTRTPTATSTCDAPARASSTRYADRPLQDRLVLARPATSPASSPTPYAISTLLHEHGALAVLGLRRGRARTSTST